MVEIENHNPFEFAEFQVAFSSRGRMNFPTEYGECGLYNFLSTVKQVSCHSYTDSVTKMTA